MIKKVGFFTVLFALCAVQSISAQYNLSLHTDYEMFFDNKEFSKTNYAVQGVDIESGTDFFGRLSLSTKLEWDGVHNLVIGGDFANNYGENTSSFFSYVKPIVHYKYDNEQTKFIAGIFTNREMHLDSYSTAFYSETSRNVDYRMSGVLAQYMDGDSFVEFVCNWNGEYSESSREKFEILSAGRHYLSTFYYGYNFLMYHFAGSMVEEENSVVDMLKFNPCVGVMFGDELKVDIKAGAILTAQCDRGYEEDWVRPMMGEAAVSFAYKGFSFDERFYFGDNINPFFDGHTLEDGYVLEYGRELYPSESFFRTDKGVYNRAAFAYNRSLSSDRVKLRAEVVTHYDGYGFGTQYILGVRVNLAPLKIKIK